MTRKAAEILEVTSQQLEELLQRAASNMLFLRKAGAPLDNNICERALKKAILHRNYAKLEIM